MLAAVLDEPTLEFRYGQVAVDPREGLSVFGPYDADSASRPASIPMVAIGPRSGLIALRRFIDLLQCPIMPSEGADERLWPAFPGFEVAFHAQLSSSFAREEELDLAELERLSLIGDPYRRAGEIVDRYLGALQRVARSDLAPRVWICVVPDDVYRRCRPESVIPTGAQSSRAISRRETAMRRAGALSLFEDYDPATYQSSVDFRRQLKARCMEIGIPVQIVRESTLHEGALETMSHRSLTPLSDRAWNLGVALYYKAGGRPWRLNTARPGVCYLGLAFRLEDGSRNSRTAACAAQMFLDSGDGVVFLGEFGPWYNPKRGSFHLPKREARRLLEGALRTFREQGGPELREIFVHSRSTILEDQFSGFVEAAPAAAKVVGVHVRRSPNSVRLYREGKYPVMRGTLLRTSEREGLLWASGYKQRLRSYDGAETPVPLSLRIQYGESDLVQVAKDILGLTKLNFNSSRMGDAEPVTVGYSDAVGEILVSNPRTVAPRPQFRFYI